MNKQEVLIFDFDGTTCDSTPGAYKGVCSVFNHCKLAPPSMREFFEYFSYPFHEFYSKRGIHLSREEMNAIYHKEAGHDTAPFFADVKESFDYHSKQSRVCIVSSNSHALVTRRCKEFGLVHPIVWRIVGDAKNKASEINFLRALSGADREHVSYIGDIKDDMIQAKAAGVNAIGITRSYPTEDLLLAGGADKVITNLRELRALVEGFDGNLFVPNLFQGTDRKILI
jgi:phosphoglycolate phosphatase-like HAD superfamily hydrolase